MNFTAALSGWRQKRLPNAGESGATVSVSRTHVGKVRLVNEDRILDAPEHRLWAVVDGMGGHSAGDIAAEAAVSALQALTRQGPIEAKAIGAALCVVNGDLRERSVRTGQMSGATIVAMSQSDDALTILWAGDCRAYRLRDGALDLLTHDHSVVQELVDAGTLTADQAVRHPHAHIVTRALGAADTLEIDSVTDLPRPGDVYLLCSDGLSRAASRIAELLRGHADFDAAADALVAHALAVDGGDNISLLLVRPAI